MSFVTGMKLLKVEPC